MDSIQESKDQSQVETNQEPKFVPAKAYQDVNQDMHKFKSRAKELEAEVNQYKAQFEALERQKLEESGKWKELAEINLEKLQKLTQEREQEKLAFVNTHKKQAVITALGGFKNDSYASFINVNGISVDEHGNPNPEEIRAEADRIRANHSELLKSTITGVLNPNAPAVSNTGVSKDYSQMTERERTAFKMSLINKK